MNPRIPRRPAILCIAIAFLLATPITQAESARRDAPAKRDDSSRTDAEAVDERVDDRDVDASRCTGKANFCAVYSQTFCSSQPGCAFSFATNTCHGIAVRCETATNAAFCGKIKGCKWK